MSSYLYLQSVDGRMLGVIRGRRFTNATSAAWAIADQLHWQRGEWPGRRPLTNFNLHRGDRLHLISEGEIAAEEARLWFVRRQNGEEHLRSVRSATFLICRSRRGRLFVRQIF